MKSLNLNKNECACRIEYLKTFSVMVNNVQYGRAFRIDLVAVYFRDCTTTTKDTASVQ